MRTTRRKREYSEILIYLQTSRTAQARDDWRWGGGDLISPGIRADRDAIVFVVGGAT
jgi:hypothetical protein